MLHFDTLKIEILPDSVRHTNWNNFLETNRSDMGSGHMETFRKAKTGALPVGVNSISWKEDGCFIAEFSAKTLKDNYLQGISLNTFAESLNSFNSIIELDHNRVMEGAGKVLKCDVTDNLQLEAIGCEHTKLYNSLLASANNPYFLQVSYTSKKKQGVEFRGVQQEKNRLIAYSKHLDLLKAANKQFIGSLKHPAKMIEAAEKQVRIESNHTAFRSIRTRFKVNQNTISKVLSSEAKVNYDFLRKVLYGKGSVQSELFQEYDSFDGSFSDFLMYKGIESIIYSMNLNEPAIKAFFKYACDKETYKYHWHKKKHSVKTILNNIKAKEYGVKVNEANNVCTSLLELLKVA